MIINDLELYVETKYKYLPNHKEYYLSLFDVDVYEIKDTLKFSIKVNEKEDNKLKSASEKSIPMKLKINESKPFTVKISSYEKSENKSIANITLSVI